MGSYCAMHDLSFFYACTDRTLLIWCVKVVLTRRGHTNPMTGHPHVPQISLRWGPNLWNGSAIPHGQAGWVHSPLVGPDAPPDLLWRSAKECEGIVSWHRCAAFQQAWRCWCQPWWVTVPRCFWCVFIVGWYLLDLIRPTSQRYWLPHAGPWWFQCYTLWTTCYCSIWQWVACVSHHRDVEGTQHSAIWLPIKIPGSVWSFCFRLTLPWCLSSE